MVLATYIIKVIYQKDALPLATRFRFDNIPRSVVGSLVHEGALEFTVLGRENERPWEKLVHLVELLLHFHQVARHMVLS